jgi:hypothetical protein
MLVVSWLDLAMDEASSRSIAAGRILRDVLDADRRLAPFSIWPMPRLKLLSGNQSNSPYRVRLTVTFFLCV